MKRYKKEGSNKLEIIQEFYARRFVLTVDRSLCKGCAICKLICPRYAISVMPATTGSDGCTLAPLIDIDENKCDFHGICAVACPFSAIKISVDGIDELPAVSKGVFPVLTRDIEIDSSKCEPYCKKCEEKCPLEIISVKTADETPQEPEGFAREAPPSQTVVDVKRELCAGCMVCWEACPTNALKVTKFIEGAISINNDLCPFGCSSCLEVCPVDALYLNDTGKIGVSDTNCIYCGACENVCPKPQALKIERTAIRHSPIESGAWNKGLEKITSTAALNKELAAGRAAKARSAAADLGVR